MDKSTEKYSSNMGVRLLGRDFIKKTFLEAMEKSGFVSAGCSAAGISKQTLSKWRQDDREFDDACKLCEAKLLKRVEDELYRRAVEGIDKPVYHQGQLVDIVNQKSDVLLMFLAKRLEPNYRDNAKLDVGIDESVVTFFQQLRANRELDDSKHTIDAQTDSYKMIEGKGEDGVTDVSGDPWDED